MGEPATVTGVMDGAASAFFRALGDETRLRAVMLLHAAGELCVCELTAAIGVSQPKMSRHLASLREAGLVRDRREGAWIHYRIAPSLPAWQLRVLESTACELAARAPFTADRDRLDAMPERPGARCG
ncbi:Arsenic resistance transcriptional regulator ArsR2 [wastewater metagenome]|uniref:Arsenic resistance transcriptional regulator ArsR2 n=2 Tax=unclassified sequences TaxID=12908 RepID=A0A5B8R8R9_9ZZZZ|nr:MULTISPECIES: metalloregulator ArsR/SmtB family transcription factor [Arhodomonas]QEA04338.1 arsenic resistance transcriptional regulator ArsR2 [uncultured organism]